MYTVITRLKARKPLLKIDKVSKADLKSFGTGVAVPLRLYIGR
jgi:hypothetical protein